MKVLITIIDNEDGSVGVTSDPDVTEMTDMLKQLVATQKNIPGSVTYAMRAMTAMLKKSTELRTEKLSKKKPKLSLVKAPLAKGKKKAPK